MNTCRLQSSTELMVMCLLNANIGFWFTNWFSGRVCAGFP